jgi:hypothetical protein
MNIAQPAISGVVAAAVSTAIQDLDLDGKMSDLYASIKAIEANTKEIAHYFRQLNQVDQIATVMLGANQFTPGPLPLNGRKYGMLFVPPGAEGITFDIPGLGPVALTLVAGWNELNFGDGLKAWMTGGTAATVLWRCSNLPFGVSVVSV